jgi:hypothetical protein
MRRAEYMKKILRLVLTMTVIAILTACYEEKPIDKYTYSWRSMCFSYVANDGNTYFTKRIRTFSNSQSNRVLDLDVTSKYDYAFYDAACTQSVGTSASNEVNYAKVTLDGQTTFLGQAVDSGVWVEASTGEVFSAYMNADAKQMYFVTFKSGETPSAWGVLSPYTKQ